MPNELRVATLLALTHYRSYIAASFNDCTPGELAKATNKDPERVREEIQSLIKRVDDATAYVLNLTEKP